MRRYWAIAGLVLGAMLLAFAGVEALGVPLLRDPSAWLGRGGAPAAAIGLGLLVGDVLIPVPSSIVMTAHGALFGILPGAALSLTGSTGATLLGFAIGRAGGPLLARLVGPAEQARANHLLERWGAVAILASRPVPLLAETVAILAGASPLGWGRAAVAAMAGSLPPALVYALAGSVAADLGSALLVLAGVLLLTGAAWLLGRRWSGERGARKDPAPNAPQHGRRATR